MKKGIGCFGDKYEIMFQNDVHAVGSVDRELVGEMVKLDDTSYEYLYSTYTDLNKKYTVGLRPLLEKVVFSLLNADPYKTIENILEYCEKIVKNFDTSIEDMIFGGYEEDIIKRGTDWCTDIARVCCVFLQIANIPSRILNIANTKLAYCGHCLVEAFYNGKWVVLDPTYGLVMKDDNGSLKSAWNIKKDPEIADYVYFRKFKKSKDICSKGAQFESIAITNYYILDYEKYNYDVSKVNEYYLNLLKHSENGWTNGISWVNGE